MKKLGRYLLANDTRAAIVAFLCTLLPLIGFPGGFIATIVVGLMTLQKGYKSGLFVLAFVALPAIALFVLRQFEYGLFDILLIHSILVWIFALVLRRWNSWSVVLESMAVVGAAGVIALHSFVPEIHHFWVNVLTHFYKQYSLANAFKLTPAKTSDFIHHVAPLATGSAAFLLFFGIFIQLILARWWQSAIFSLGSVHQEFIKIRIDRIAAVVLIAATVCVYWQPAWLIDLYPVLLLPFMVAGLSFVHQMMAKRKKMIFLLIVMYIALFILNFIMVVLLALLGFIDSWLHLQKNRQLTQNG